MQRTRKGRNGRIAMRHTTKTTNIRPSIPRMRKKRGESWSTNKAGTAVTIAKIVSPIQSSIFSIQSNRRFSRQLNQHRRAGGGVGTAEPPQYRMLLAAVHESGNGTSPASCWYMPKPSWPALLRHRARNWVHPPPRLSRLVSTFHGRNFCPSASTDRHTCLCRIASAA